MKDLKIGIQMYTIREALKQDFKGVCRELVKLGCDGAEFAFYFGDMEPAELGAFTKEIGLKACGMHVSAGDFADPHTKTFDYARALGVKYVTISCCFGAEKLEESIALCAGAGKTAAENGFQFTYHNHAQEFAKLSNGESALDVFYQRTDPKQVMAELDVYWVTKGGEDPVKYIRRYANRLPQLHLKDMDPADGSFTELGNGKIDLASCVREAKDTICEWVIYEQDVCKRPAFESAVISIGHIKKLLGR